MTKDYKLNWNALLRAVDARDYDWLDKQSDEARKEFGLVQMRMASYVKEGVAAGCLLWVINQRVNHRLFDLTAEKDLSFRLLASCGLKRSLARTWIDTKRGSTDNVASRLLGSLEPLASDVELHMLLRSYSREEFTELVRDCGLSKEDISACLRAFDKAIAA